VLHVLLIQLKRIGDLVLTVPAIAAVRKNFPAAKISLVVAHGSRELLPAIPGVDQTLVARGRISDAVPWFAVARARFDYCLDFSRTDRSAFLTLLSGARKRITYDTIRREPLRQLSYTEFVPSKVRLVHTVDHHLALLAPLGVHDAATEIELVLPQAARTVPPPSSLSTIWPATSSSSIQAQRSEKFWMASRWAEVANCSIHCVLPVASHGWNKTTRAHQIAPSAPGAGFVRATGSLHSVRSSRGALLVTTTPRRCTWRRRRHSAGCSIRAN
jgi:ADP-heptose:LPS heptosyltransferase